MLLRDVCSTDNLWLLRDVIEFCCCAINGPLFQASLPFKLSFSKQAAKQSRVIRQSFRDFNALVAGELPPSSGVKLAVGYALA